GANTRPPSTSSRVPRSARGAVPEPLRQPEARPARRRRGLPGERRGYLRSGDPLSQPGQAASELPPPLVRRVSLLISETSTVTSKIRKLSRAAQYTRRAS